jgi:hypothetical protein
MSGPGRPCVRHIRDASWPNRTLFQDTGDYNLHVVVSRGQDEKHTHVLVTYLRKPGVRGATPKRR